MPVQVPAAQVEPASDTLVQRLATLQRLDGLAVEAERVARAPDKPFMPEEVVVVVVTLEVIRFGEVPAAAAAAILVAKVPDQRPPSTAATEALNKHNANGADGSAPGGGGSAVKAPPKRADVVVMGARSSRPTNRIWNIKLPNTLKNTK